MKYTNKPNYYPPYSRYYDEEGNPVKRTREEYPYSYDCYVQWQNPRIRKDAEGVGEAYDDRIRQWDYEKHEKAREAAGNNGMFSQGDIPAIETYLRTYYDDPTIELVTLLQGCNVSNGYPYWYFRWLSHKEK